MYQLYQTLSTCSISCMSHLDLGFLIIIIDTCLLITSSSNVRNDYLQNLVPSATATPGSMQEYGWLTPQG